MILFLWEIVFQIIAEVLYAIMALAEVCSMKGISKQWWMVRPQFHFVSKSHSQDMLSDVYFQDRHLILSLDLIPRTNSVGVRFLDGPFHFYVIANIC